MAVELSAVQYLECSAKANQGIKEVFVAATLAALEAKAAQGCKCVLL